MKWLEHHDFAKVPNSATSHQRYEHQPTGIVVMVPGHGRAELSKKHLGMTIRVLEQCGFERDQLKRELA